MKNIIKTILMIACISSLGIRASAQQTDFSGSWQLNKAKGDFGQQDPDKVTARQLIVRQQTDAITIKKVIIGSDGQDKSYAETFSFDGKPTTTVLPDTVNGKQTRLTKVQWSADHKTLHLSASTTVEINGQTAQYTNEQVWMLSGDGKMLTVKDNTVLPDRKETFTAVYDRQ